MVDRRPGRVLAGAVLLLGCGGDAAVDADLVPTIVVEETLRIGSVDDPETSLTSFGVIEIAPDGRIFTIHAQEQHIRIHAPDGAPAGVIGRRGDGPGEFQGVASLGFVDDEIWVVDSRSGRVTWFDMAGEYLRDESYRAASSTDPLYFPPRPLGRFSDGTLFGVASIPSRLVASGDITHSATMRFRLDGEIVDTVAVRLLGNGQLAMPFRDGGLYTRQPFGDAPIVVVTSEPPLGLSVDRTVVPGKTSFSVATWALPADTLWRRDVPFDPIPLPASVADSFGEAFGADIIERGMMTRSEWEAGLSDNLFVPDHLPAVARALIGRDGSVWLELHDRTPDTAKWLVLDVDGDVYGEFLLSERVLPLNVRLDRFWARALDDLDVPYIVRYSVTRAASPETTR